MVNNFNKTIILGDSINQYIGNFTIFVYTIIFEKNINKPTFYTIWFKKSGQYINFVSICDLTSKYYQILNSHITSKNNVDSTSLEAGHKNIINNTANIETNIVYTNSELNKMDILFYNENIDNIISITTKYTMIELNHKLTKDIYVYLPLLSISAFEKNIILGESIEYYSNNYNIIVYSKFIDLEGRGPVFANIKLKDTGNCIKLTSINYTTDDNILDNYWQILNGNFNNTDEIIKNSNNEYVNIKNPNEPFNYLVDASLVANSLVDTLYITSELNNTIPVTNKITLIQFTIPITNNLTINLPIERQYGVERTILIGDSLPSDNNKFIQIKSNFFAGINNQYFSTVTLDTTIKFNKAGQNIKLMAMRSSENINYWHILSGDFTI